MYQLLNKINMRFPLVLKSDFKYQCTFMLAMLGLLSVFSAIFLSLIFFVSCPWIPSLHFTIDNPTPERIMNLKILSIGIIASFILLFLALNENKVFMKIINIVFDLVSDLLGALGKVVSYSFKKTLNFYTLLLDKFCKKIE